ncbi:MAG: DUF2726 domain-containing protein [Ottowia sp.]|uniref:DUF2726 domain-containing protein n=1 Tax=Ottowia sp. TaxID=1898956 RepID=UPI0039E6B227
MDASSFFAPWLERWQALAGDGWGPAASTAIALLALALLWRAVRRAPRPRAPYDPRGDQFAYTAPITEEQIALLHYLQRAFPEGAVLFRPRLARFLAVRKSRQRLGAQQRLAEAQVDFLICAEDGKPLFAFEVDAFKDKDDPLLQREAAEKNLMLKTAGIRLIRLKGAHVNWPPPEILRLRMLAAQRTPGVEARPSGFGPSEFATSSFMEPSGFAHSRGAPSSVMGLSTLMGMEPVEGDPWANVRKRS